VFIIRQGEDGVPGRGDLPQGLGISQATYFKCEEKSMPVLMPSEMKRFARE